MRGMKKKTSERIMYVLCMLQVLGLGCTFKVGLPIWHYLLVLPPLYVGWYLDRYCHIFNEEEEGE